MDGRRTDTRNRPACPRIRGRAQVINRKYPSILAPLVRYYPSILRASSGAFTRNGICSPERGILKTIFVSQQPQTRPTGCVASEENKKLVDRLTDNDNAGDIHGLHREVETDLHHPSPFLAWKETTKTWTETGLQPIIWFGRREQTTLQKSRDPPSANKVEANERTFSVGRSIDVMKVDRALS